MSSLATSSVVFLIVMGSALLGMLLRRRLPQHHLAPESKDVVNLGAGLIGTMAALVLGLMVASAKSSYDTQQTQFVQMSVKIAMLDPAPRPLRAGGTRGLASMLASSSIAC